MNKQPVFGRMGPRDLPSRTLAWDSQQKSNKQSNIRSVDLRGSLVVPDKVAVATIDPGGISGVARGIFYPSAAESMYDAVAQAALTESWECEGTVIEQVTELVEELGDWLVWAHIEQSVPLPYLFLVVEDFQLRQRSVDLRPVQITSAFEMEWNATHGAWVPITKQQPSEAMTYATNARLRAWGAWVRGSEHRRDAVRHLLTKVSKLMDGIEP